MISVSRYIILPIFWPLNFLLSSLPVISPPTPYLFLRLLPWYTWPDHLHKSTTLPQFQFQAFLFLTTPFQLSSLFPLVPQSQQSFTPSLCPFHYPSLPTYFNSLLIWLRCLGQSYTSPSLWPPVPCTCLGFVTAHGQHSSNSPHSLQFPQIVFLLLIFLLLYNTCCNFSHLKKTTIFNILLFPPATMLSLFPCIENKQTNKLPKRVVSITASKSFLSFSLGTFLAFLCHNPTKTLFCKVQLFILSPHFTLSTRDFILFHPFLHLDIRVRTSEFSIFFFCIIGYSFWTPKYSDRGLHFFNLHSLCWWSGSASWH